MHGPAGRVTGGVELLLLALLDGLRMPLGEGAILRRPLFPRTLPLVVLVKRLFVAQLSADSAGRGAGDTAAAVVRRAFYRFSQPATAVKRIAY